MTQYGFGFPPKILPAFQRIVGSGYKHFQDKCGGSRQASYGTGAVRPACSNNVGFAKKIPSTKSGKYTLVQKLIGLTMLTAKLEYLNRASFKDFLVSYMRAIETRAACALIVSLYSSLYWSSLTFTSLDKVGCGPPTQKEIYFNFHFFSS